MVESLNNLPTRHLFYLSYNSHPIALSSRDGDSYSVVETVVERSIIKEREYYVFHHRVEHRTRHTRPVGSFSIMEV